jgi:kinesin family protein C2/C3
MKEIMERYKRELSERKKLHNIIQELKGNIRVYLRCRPPTSKEIEQFGNDAQCVAFPAPGEIKVYNEKNREKVWEFDEVFDTNSNQESVYKEVSALVTSVLDGFNVCIFADGQTGSGKTYTMSGPVDDRGVNTRALNELFSKVSDRKSEYVDTISVSILEVYNEEIRDLLADGPGDKLDVRQGDFGNYVPGLTCIAVRNLQNVIDLMALADKNRSSATTNMNEHSSRSHMMLQVIVQSENTTTGVNSRGKLNLVDLAGSERLNKSGAVGQALKEAQNINKSLSALGDVIAARASKQSHIPFRNSTLTYLLQDSLSQDSKTLMIVCISPVLYNSEESFCSLNFAARVRTVELGKASKTITNGGATSSKAPSTGPASTKSGVRK